MLIWGEHENSITSGPCTDRMANTAICLYQNIHRSFSPKYSLFGQTCLFEYLLVIQTGMRSNIVQDHCCSDLEIQLTLVISTSFISNNCLSRSENLVPA